MKLNLGCYLIFFFVTINIFAQYPHVEAENHSFAYWNYQRKLEKWFITQAGDFNISGSGMPASRVNFCENTIGWGDATIDLGWYIAKLALEYKLLVSVGEDTTYIVQKLYEELSTLNRLDCYEESYETGITPPNCEGYFVRDDVYENNFGRVVTPGKTYDHDHYESDFRSAKGGDWTILQESQDQIYYLLMGLKCITDNIPSSVTYKYAFTPNQYYTPTSSITDEAKGLANRLCYYMRDRGHWLNFDPPSFWDWTIYDNARLGKVDRGSNGFWFSTGTDGTQKNIIGQATQGLPVPFSGQGTIFDVFFQLNKWAVSKFSWYTLRHIPFLGHDNEHMYEILVSMANNSFINPIFRKSRTARLLKWRSTYWSLEHTPLFYAVSFNASCWFEPNYYWNMMKDENILTGSYRYYGNVFPSQEWSTTQRFIHPQSRYPASVTPFYGEYNNLDYMFLFNIFYMKNWNNLPPYLNGNKAHISSLVSFPYHGYGTITEPYVVQAYESIEAVNNVTSSSIVTYRAGDHIDLKPGFIAENGSSFLAYIEPLPEDNEERPCVSPRLSNGHNISNTIKPNFISELNSEVTPNPVTNTFNISLNLLNDSKVVIRLYNQYGQEINELANNSFKSGINNLNFDISQYSGGCYFLKILINSNTLLTKKIIKL